MIAALCALCVVQLAAPSADSGLAGALAERWGVPPSAVVWQWVRPPVAQPEEGRIRVLSTTPDGQISVQVVVGQVNVGPPAVARAGVLRTVARATRALPRGHRLDLGDRVLTVDTLWGGPRGLPAPPDVLGWETRAALPPGAILVTPRVAPAAAIAVGDSVTLMWREGGAEVQRRGLAMSRGQMGDTVTVRLPGLRQPVMARVIGARVGEAL
jgi:flagella basal body P-ring formation protein FlgA